MTRVESAPSRYPGEDGAPAPRAPHIGVRDIPPARLYRHRGVCLPSVVLLEESQGGDRLVPPRDPLYQDGRGAHDRRGNYEPVVGDLGRVEELDVPVLPDCRQGHELPDVGVSTTPRP